MSRSALPLKPGPAHFIGIGGIGMSGIAEIMLRQGYLVQGSDAKASANTERLARLGARIFVGHDPAHIAGAAAIVYSTAIAFDNPELAAGRAARLPLVRRAEMLAELMRLKLSVAVAGAHGKTTTTSMIAALLEAGGLDPTVVNGGVINAYGANAKVGDGDWIVVEADESDGTFLKLPRTACVVTNIDAEHLDYYGSYEAVERAFGDFVEGVAFYGFAALCLDDPPLQTLAGRLESRRAVTYGFNPEAEVRATRLAPANEGWRFEVAGRLRGGREFVSFGPAPADGGPSQCPERPGGDRRRPRTGGGRGRHPRGSRQLFRCAAAVHQGGRGRRRADRGRLRPPPDRDRQRALGGPRAAGAARRGRAGDRGGPAASL